MNTNILLIGFYNEKALGVKYLANEIKRRGYTPHIIFFKKFNSVNPTKATEKELDLLKQLIHQINPACIGLSIMSSLYLETVFLVNDHIRKNFRIPIIWGGVYPSLFPEESLAHADYVIRGEGERPFTAFLTALNKNLPMETVPNLVFLNSSGDIIKNDLLTLTQNLDELGYPQVEAYSMYLIHENHIYPGDPQLLSFTYETTASRGCPFSCSYCSSINLKRMYHQKGSYVRFRSVDNVLEELTHAKEKLKNIKVIHFWDEIFSDTPGWIEEFGKRYKEEIGLPFKIWAHPLKINERIIKNLVNAGLYQVVVGIQSGSTRIRKEVFHRSETQEQIIHCSKVLSQSKVPRIIYDFMLLHPFETMEDLKETFELCLKMSPPFQLQLHGLNFLPGTDIVDMALEQSLLTPSEMNQMMYCSIQDQYDMYWGPSAMKDLKEKNGWLSLIYLTQFPSMHSIIRRLIPSMDENKNTKAVALSLHKIMKTASKGNELIEKARLVINK